MGFEQVPSNPICVAAIFFATNWIILFKQRQRIHKTHLSEKLELLHFCEIALNIKKNGGLIVI